MVVHAAQKCGYFFNALPGHFSGALLMNPILAPQEILKADWILILLLEPLFSDVHTYSKCHDA